MSPTRCFAVFALSAIFHLGLPPAPTRAEVSEIKVSRGFGMVYLPLFVMEQNRLLERRAREAGLGDIKASYLLVDGGNNINTALLAGSLDIASIGVPGFLTLWAKARGNPQLEISGLGALSTSALYLNTTNPNVKTLRDFTPQDRIAVPGVKTSLPAGVLQMLVAKEFGQENFAKLDGQTVGVPYPDAMAAMISGKSEITAHLTSPPFSLLELDHPHVHRVLNSVDVLGHPTMMVTFASRKFHDANPKMCAAFLAALEEADALIKQDKRAAVQAYLKVSKLNASEAELLRVLDDPDTGYSTTPEGVLHWAEFMHSTGGIKVKPQDWKELFFPEIHRLPGS